MVPSSEAAFYLLHFEDHADGACPHFYQIELRAPFAFAAWRL
jgi:hypothetical protein